jgi:Amino acid permease
MATPRYRYEGDTTRGTGFPEDDSKIQDSLDEKLPELDVKQRDVVTRVIHSFKRQEMHVRTMDEEGGIPRPGDTSQLHRKLKSRHLQMISIGGAIGAGLFIGSGRALATGGPGAVLLDFGLIGAMLFCTVNALGELATLFPVQGTLSDVHMVMSQARLRSFQLGLSTLPGDLRWAGIMLFNGSPSFPLSSLQRV